MTGQRQPSLPPKITGFEYVGLLGMGGFADVFEYRQDFPRRSVAVKVLLASSVDQGARDGFFTEANIMAGLSQHPSIVTIHQAAIASDGRPYFVMEYCSKPSLGARFRNERISVAETLRTGIRVASAVETAHRLGVLHRDIKPANILATDFGWPALTDFGIAGTVGDKLAAAGMSIPWAPPELISDHPTGDARSDVYSLAATLYSLLAGKSPFEYAGKPNSPLDLMARIERDPVLAVDRVDVPTDLNSVLARAMAKNPEQRYSSALAFAHALQNIEREMQLPVTGIDVTEIGSHRPASSAAEAPALPHASTPHGGWDGVQERTVLASNAPRNPDDDEATRLRSIVTVDAQSGVESHSASPKNLGKPAPLPAQADIGERVSSGNQTHPDQARSVSAHSHADSGQAEVETRLRPVTTISSEKPAVQPEPDSYSPESGKRGVFKGSHVQAANQPTKPEHNWSPLELVDPELQHAPAIFEPKQFDETTGSTGYFYKKRVQADAQAKAAGKRITFLVSLASILMLVGVLVYIGLKGLGSNAADPTNEPSHTSPSAPGVVTVPPVQELEVIAQTDDSVTFGWKNPDPLSGDAYLWRTTDATNQGAQNRITDPQVTVPKTSKDEPVCIEVSLVRANGTMSHTAEKGCN